MRVSDSYQEIGLLDGRKAILSARNAAFTISPATSRSFGLTSATHREYGRKVIDDLIDAGFEPVSELLVLEGIDIPRKKNRSYQLNLERGDLVDRSTANFSIPVQDEETLVGVEFDPASGQVLDWHFAVAKTEALRKSSLDRTSAAEGSQPLEGTTLEFSVALYSAYPVESGTKYRSNKEMRRLGRRVLRFFSVNLVQRPLRALLNGPIKKLDKWLSNDNVFGFFNPQGLPKKISTRERKEMEGKRVLLLVHGIISDTATAFQGIAADSEFYDELSAAYSGNILAYDHLTLTKDITRNAEELAARLPKRCEIDIVCHSRGAAVVRSLLELPSLQAKCDRDGRRFRKVCFVAGACEGSDLASEDAVDRIFSVFNKMSVLLGGRALATNVVAAVIKLGLRGVQSLPGTVSMEREGDYIQELRKTSSTLASEYGYIRANFDSDRVAIAAIDNFLIDITLFDSKGNDIVVPFETAGVTDNYLAGRVTKTSLLDLGSEEEPQHSVWHISFFYSEEVKEALRNGLGL